MTSNGSVFRKRRLSIPTTVSALALADIEDTSGEEAGGIKKEDGGGKGDEEGKSHPSVLMDKQNKDENDYGIVDDNCLKECDDEKNVVLAREKKLHVDNKEGFEEPEKKKSKSDTNTNGFSGSGDKRKDIVTICSQAGDVGRQLTDDEVSKLPFPRSVLGMYSCPGLEPIYEAEDDGEEQENSESYVTCVAKINQDRGGASFPYGSDTKCALFAAYDGHGEEGGEVADYAMKEIQTRLENHKDFHANINNAFRDVFLSVDEALKSVQEIEPIFSGTTACVVLMRDKKLFIANVGDSRAVLGRNVNGSFSSVDLSIDQNPDSPGEMSRIENCGGFVSPPPEVGLSARVWLDEDYTQIGLAMARSIGDHAVKAIGVIADPVVTTHNLIESDEFLIIATDGVWEFISSEEAVLLVSSFFSQGLDASVACEQLIEKAASKWKEIEGDYRDDITAVIVRIDHLCFD